MKIARPLAAVGLAAGLAFGGCEPAYATPAPSAAGAAVGVLLADPNDVVCATEGGTRIWCKHTLGANAGDVIVAMENYAGCPSTEDSCGTVYTVPTSGPHAGDGHLLVVGLGS